MVEDELADPLAIGGPAGGVAHRVDAKLQLGRVKAQSAVELHEHDDALGVSRGVGSAEPLDADLVELAETTLLGALATEHGLGVPELDGSCALRHEVVLDRGANDARGPLGPHGDALLGLEAGLGARLEEVLEERAGDDAEHLLAHDVGRLPDAMDEGVHLLERRRLDHVEAVCPEELASHVLHVLPGAHVPAVQVLGTLDLLCHGGTSPRAFSANSRPRPQATSGARHLPRPYGEQVYPVEKDVEGPRLSPRLGRITSCRNAVSSSQRGRQQNGR